jgi:hypothetical protein
MPFLQRIHIQGTPRRLWLCGGIVRPIVFGSVVGNRPLPVNGRRLYLHPLPSVNTMEPRPSSLTIRPELPRLLYPVGSLWLLGERHFVAEKARADGDKVKLPV